VNSLDFFGQMIAYTVVIGQSPYFFFPSIWTFLIFVGRRLLGIYPPKESGQILG